MDEERQSRLSRTSGKVSVHSIKSPNTSQEVDVEDGQTTTRSTEDDINLQCTSANIYKDSNNDDREPMFVIVDSNCVSNPSSNEILINKKHVIMDNSLKTKCKRNVIPIGIPCSSRDQTTFVLTQDQDGEFREEMEMIDINLQSENEIFIEEDNNETEPESIVIAYLRNKDAILDRDGLPTTRKKSSILENVPKMETIPEDKQFSSFSGQLRICDSTESQHTTEMKKLSDNSLDAYIPSCPGSPRSFIMGPSTSMESIVVNYEDDDPVIGIAVKILHQDKEFLLAAEVGNYRLLEMYIRRRIDVQQMDHFGRNALHLAVCSDSFEAVRVLLEAGVNPNVVDNVGMTPLTLLMRRPSLRVAQQLFDHGAVISPRSDPMDTGFFIQFVMMCTPTQEEDDLLRLLVQKGAIINDPHAPGGRQALHFAAMSNNTTLIRSLVSLGADLYMKNHRNETPKDVAETFRCLEAYELLNELEEDDLSTTSVSSDKGL